MIRHLPEEILAQMSSFELDAHVRKILKNYQALQEEREERRSADV